MGIEQRSGVGGQPEPKPANQLEKHPLLKVAGTVIAAVGAIVIVNEIASRVKRFMEGEKEAISLSD